MRPVCDSGQRLGDTAEQMSKKFHLTIANRALSIRADLRAGLPFSVVNSGLLRLTLPGSIAYSEVRLSRPVPKLSSSNLMMRVPS